MLLAQAYNGWRTASSSIRRSRTVFAMTEAAAIELVRKGRVRRAKLYFLRRLAGKAARIREKRGVIVPGTEPQQA